MAQDAERPAVPGIVSRPVLFERLRDAARVTEVSAPPGSGKTSPPRGRQHAPPVGDVAAEPLAKSLQPSSTSFGGRRLLE